MFTKTEGHKQRPHSTAESRIGQQYKETISSQQTHSQSALRSVCLYLLDLGPKPLTHSFLKVLINYNIEINNSQFSCF